MPTPTPQRKYDLKAAKNVEGKYPQWGLWGAQPGHKPGIAVGQRFSGRGPLKAVGIHSTYFTGIQGGGWARLPGWGGAWLRGGRWRRRVRSM